VLKLPAWLSNEVRIIAYSAKKINYPISRGDFIRSYRKKNRAVRHEYLTLATKYGELSKSMFTFTVGGRGTYQKLRLINEIKSYVTYLIANSNAEIYFFSNIELGHSFTNPHLHTQLWCDDKEAVRAIYEKIITKFGLDIKRCKLSEPQQHHHFYSYVLKDYAESLTDEQVYKLESIKKKYRKQLGLKLRFYSRSKSKYSQKAYRYFYRAFGVLRGLADDFMDWFFSLFFKKKRIFKVSISSFITIKNKGRIVLLVLVKRLIFWIVLEILFYSPARGPPVLLYEDIFLSLVLGMAYL